MDTTTTNRIKEDAMTYQITGSNHDSSGLDAEHSVSVTREGRKNAERSATLMSECGYQNVVIEEVKPIGIAESFLAESKAVYTERIMDSERSRLSVSNLSIPFHEWVNRRARTLIAHYGFLEACRMLREG
jgi:hypothetical protein